MPELEKMNYIIDGSIPGLQCPEPLVQFSTYDKLVYAVDINGNVWGGTRFNFHIIPEYQNAKNVYYSERIGLCVIDQNGDLYVCEKLVLKDKNIEKVASKFALSYTGEVYRITYGKRYKGSNNLAWKEALGCDPTPYCTEIIDIGKFRWRTHVLTKRGQLHTITGGEKAIESVARVFDGPIMYQNGKIKGLTTKVTIPDPENVVYVSSDDNILHVLRKDRTLATYHYGWKPIIENVQCLPNQFVEPQTVMKSARLS